jgi:hypothetical protein
MGEAVQQIGKDGKGNACAAAARRFVVDLKDASILFADRVAPIS